MKDHSSCWVKQRLEGVGLEVEGRVEGLLAEIQTGKIESLSKDSVCEQKEKEANLGSIGVTNVIHGVGAHQKTPLCSPRISSPRTP